MKKTFKITALIVALLILVTAMPLGVFAEAEEDAVPEGEQKPISSVHQEAIDALLRFGIFNEETFFPEEKVTRGNFLSAAMQLTGASEVFRPTDTEFFDVKADTPNSSAIAAAVSMGIISGYGDNSFRPDATLTYEQGIKILVSLLGYDVHALSYGGYPGGYFMIAARQGLLKKIAIGDYAEFTGSQAAQLIYNALSVDVLQRKKYPQEKFITREGENPMTLYMGIYKAEGVIYSNDVTSLATADGNRADHVTIKVADENELFEEHGTGAGNYLGMPVKAYYKLNENGAKQLMIVTVKSTVNEIYIDAENIDDKTSEKSIYWYEGEKHVPSSMPLTDNPVVIYNGKYYSFPPTASLLKPESGGLRLIDTDGDSRADFIFVTDAEIYVVKSISSAGIIKDKYGKTALNIAIDDPDIILDITKHGETITFGDITENMVLTVTKSQDGKYIKIEASSGKVKGKIDEIGDDYIVVSGQEFKIVKSNINEMKKLEIGYIINFFLTSNEVIAGYNEAKAPGTSYGYALLGGMKKAGLAREDSAIIRIYTLSGNIQEFKFDEKPTFNGERVSANGQGYTGADILKLLSVVPSSVDSKSDIQQVFCNQLVEYTLNNDGKIKNISTALNNTAVGKYNEEFSLDYVFRSLSSSSYLTYREFGFIGGKFDASGCSIFKVPQQSVWESLYNGSVSIDDIEKQIALVDTAGWGDNYKIYNMDIYDIGEMKNCSIIVEYSEAATIPDLDLFLVDKISTALDSEGTLTKKLYGCYKGENKGYILDMNYLSEKDINLKQGDIVRVAVDLSGSIRAIYKIFTMKKADSGQYLNGGYLLNGEEYNCFGHAATSNAPAPWSGYSDKASVASDWNRLHTVMHGKYSAIAGDNFPDMVQYQSTF